MTKTVVPCHLTAFVLWIENVNVPIRAKSQFVSSTPQDITKFLIYFSFFYSKPSPKLSTTKLQKIFKKTFFRFILKLFQICSKVILQNLDLNKIVSDMKKLEKSLLFQKCDKSRKVLLKDDVQFKSFTVRYLLLKTRLADYEKQVKWKSEINSCWCSCCSASVTPARSPLVIGGAIE